MVKQQYSGTIKEELLLIDLKINSPKYLHFELNL
jgi:hypothetical protein